MVIVAWAFFHFFNYLYYNKWSKSRGSRHVRRDWNFSPFHLRFIYLTKRSGGGLKIALSPRSEGATATPNGLYIAMVTEINREVNPRTDSRENRQQQSKDASSPLDKVPSLQHLAHWICSSRTEWQRPRCSRSTVRQPTFSLVTQLLWTRMQLQLNFRSPSGLIKGNGRIAQKHQSSLTGGKCVVGGGICLDLEKNS